LANSNEVGNTIKELASEDANVVVGMSVDPEMRNELRVTIVATGIGQGIPAKPANSRERETAIPHVKLVQQQRLDRAAVSEGCAFPLRRTGRRQKAAAIAWVSGPMPELEYLDLDIPAFLRRQAPKLITRAMWNPL
jgi:cell division protein FtsZ